LEHFYSKATFVRKLKKSLDGGEPGHLLRKLHVYRMQQQAKGHVLDLAQQTILENCTKVFEHLIRAAAHGIR